ncbi:hypothetical protein C1645_841083 [Glomus cerebriforme]|uniref:Uncharacterized protein n=1 Tax=Glomus cerebriforme TaxID=658196 RepID=A0A397S987_9GLOM|nr:hypothetical protein C1645_841083 [Glomus cerebriforme]
MVYIYGDEIPNYEKIGVYGAISGRIEETKEDWGLDFICDDFHLSPTLLYKNKKDGRVMFGHYIWKIGEQKKILDKKVKELRERNSQSREEQDFQQNPQGQNQPNNNPNPSNSENNENNTPNSDQPTNPGSPNNPLTQTPNPQNQPTTPPSQPNQNPPQPLNLTPLILDKFKPLKNFNSKEKLEVLINPVKDNPEFEKELKKQNIEDLNSLLVNKNSKEIIILIKLFEFNKNKNKNKKIRQYYHLKDNQALTNEQINEYLYKEAVGELEQQQKEQNNHNHKNKEWLVPVVVGGIILTILILIGCLVSRKKKKFVKRK